MEAKFQTSFIPKKPAANISGTPNLAPKHHIGNSWFMTLGVLMFLVSLLAAGAAFGWKQYLIADQANVKSELAKREQRFDLNRIEQLKQLSVKLDTAQQIIQNHIAVSQIFDIVGHFTSEHVRFLSLDLTTPSASTGASDGIKIALKGYGTSFSAVAWQSDVLGQLEQYGLRKVVKNPILTDPSLDSNGSVSFGFTATIDPGSLSYSRAIGLSATSTTP